MDGTGDQFFASTAFSLDQDIRIRRGDLLDQTEYLLQAFAVADDLGEGLLLATIAAQYAILMKQIALLDRVLDGL